MPKRRHAAQFHYKEGAALPGRIRRAADATMRGLLLIRMELRGEDSEEALQEERAYQVSKLPRWHPERVRQEHWDAAIAKVRRRREEGADALVVRWG